MTDIDPEVPTPAVPTPEKASLAEDFIDIFFSPRAVFARRANSGFFLVMCVLTLLLGGLFLANRGVMSGIMDAEFARGMAAAAKANPSMTDAQMETARKFQGYALNFGAFIGVPIMILLVGLGAWITGKIVGARLSYTAAAMITAYSCIPRIIESLGVNVQGWLIDTDALTGRYQLSLGVGRFMSPDMNPGLLGLLGRLDVFTLWVTVLLAIGIGVVGKLPKEKAIVAGVVMWVFGALPSLWTLVRG